MPTTDEFGQGVTIASLTDAPDASKLARDLANAIAPRGVMRFASASARGATLVGAAAPVEGMATWLQDVNRLEMYNGSSWVTPPDTLTSTTSGLTVKTGFALNDFAAYREGRVIAVDVYLSRTGSTINEDDGNIVDTDCCTLPSGWRPTHQTINGCWDSGVAGGGFAVGTDGVCTLRTATGNVANGSNLRLHVVFIKTT